ncbi:MAG: permease [Thermoflexales bacterium]|nr:permease [Thermoflexales bacterium]MCS7324384.1 permease [Thermoflexales bacterium]MDW8053291.1 permease [Anaerolineae bacterium]MDW8291942.1 permease [Anaerolineae bacterium]
MSARRVLALAGAMLVVIGIALLGDVLALRLPALPDAAHNFVTVFLGIFIEALPFLLLGSLTSGLIAEFVSPEDVARFFPRPRAASALSGALMGLAFPVCECGAVPVVRRLYRKGLPTPAGIAFLLAAPVVNPIVLASTYAAFGLGPVLGARVVLTVIVAVGIGLVIGTQPTLTRLLTPRTLLPVAGGAVEMMETRRTLTARFQSAFDAAMDDFLDMGRFLVAGSLLAAGLQSFIPQSALISIGRDPLSSVVALQALAFVLSVCSTVDSFLALSFVNTFTTGSIIAFLVFGPMIDLKSSVMYWTVFRPRVVIYMLVLAFLFALLAGVFINLNLPW